MFNRGQLRSEAALMLGGPRGLTTPHSAEPVVELCRTEETFFGEDLGVTAVMIR